MNGPKVDVVSSIVEQGTELKNWPTNWRSEEFQQRYNIVLFLRLRSEFEKNFFFVYLPVFTLESERA